MPILERLRWRDLKFEASQGFIARLGLQIIQRNRKDKTNAAR